MNLSQEADSERRQKLLEARKHVEENPEQAASWIQLGLLLSQYGDKTGAVRAFDKALTIDPDNKYARSRLDMLMTHPEALTQVSRTFSSAPSHTNPWFTRIFWIVASVVIASLILRFFIFKSTYPVVVNEDNNSFPIFAAENPSFGYSSIRGNPMYFRAFTGGSFHIAKRPGDTAELFRPDGQPSRDDKDSQYCFSSDAEWVAFVRQRSVCIAKRDGSGFRIIEEGNSPQWSPTGRQLAFIGSDTSQPYSASNSLILIDFSSDSRLQLADSISDSFAWSPTGQAIAFVSEPHEWSPMDVMMMQGADAEGEEASDEDAYVTPYRISVVDVMTRDIVDLPETGNLLFPAWMPDGRTILYFASKSTGTEIHAAAPDGTNTRTLYGGSPARFSYPGPICVSFDGKWIVFEALAAGETETETIEVPDAYRGYTGAPTIQTRAMDFQPDLFAARTDGSNCHRLVNIHDSKSHPQFQPGTHWIYYHTIPLGGKVQIWKTKVR